MTVLHVVTSSSPEGVIILTDPDEPLARVQPPRVEEEGVFGAEAEAPEAGAEAHADGGGAASDGASEDAG